MAHDADFDSSAYLEVAARSRARGPDAEDALQDGIVNLLAAVREKRIIQKKEATLRLLEERRLLFWYRRRRLLDIFRKQERDPDQPRPDGEFTAKDGRPNPELRAAQRKELAEVIAFLNSALPTRYAYVFRAWLKFCQNVGDKPTSRELAARLKEDPSKVAVDMSRSLKRVRELLAEKGFSLAGLTREG